MSSTLVKERYVISKITGPDSAEVISDGALFQRDGEIVAGMRVSYAPTISVYNSRC